MKAFMYPGEVAGLEQAMASSELWEEYQRTPILPGPGLPFSLSQAYRAGLTLRAGQTFSPQIMDGPQLSQMEAPPACGRRGERGKGSGAVFHKG